VIFGRQVLSDRRSFACGVVHREITDEGLTAVDGVASAQFSAGTYVVNENAGSVTVGVTRSGNVSRPVTINYATSNGTAETSTDYVATSGALQFAPGETIKFFSVPIVDDDLVERTETINVSLSGAAGVVLGSPFNSTITILDDDKPLIATEENTGRAAALDSVTFVREPFSLTNVTFPAYLAATSWASKLAGSEMFQV